MLSGDKPAALPRRNPECSLGDRRTRGRLAFREAGLNWPHPHRNSPCVLIFPISASPSRCSPPFRPARPRRTGRRRAKPKAGRFMVGVKKSPFYKYGPAQAFGPDFALPQGQRLTLVEHSFGFSRVMTDDGVAGFMPTEDLVPAPAEPAPAAAPRMASRRGGIAAAGIAKPSTPARIARVSPSKPSRMPPRSSTSSTCHSPAKPKMLPRRSRTRRTSRCPSRSSACAERTHRPGCWVEGARPSIIRGSTVISFQRANL